MSTVYVFLLHKPQLWDILKISDFVKRRCLIFAGSNQLKGLKKN